MSETISNKVLEEIKEKNVSLKPRWQFMLKNYTVWILGFISLIVGSLSFAVILYMLRNNDWDIYTQVSGNIFSFIILTLPYFWLIFLSIFILAAYYNIKHTKKGYRFSISKIVLLSVSISIMGGSLLYGIGAGQAIDNMVEDKIPFYGRFINHRKAIWERHEQGFMAGVVIDIDNDEAIVRDISGDIWHVSNFSTSSPQVEMINEGEAVRILGEMGEEGTFKVKTILPMKGMPWVEKPVPMPPCEGDCPFERKIKGVRINN